MNKKTNTVLFVLGATVFNLILMAIDRLLQVGGLSFELLQRVFGVASLRRGVFESSFRHLLGGSQVGNFFLELRQLVPQRLRLRLVAGQRTALLSVLFNHLPNRVLVPLAIVRQPFDLPCGCRDLIA